MRNSKSRNKLRTWLAILGLASLVACSSQQQQDDDLELDENYGDQQGNDYGEDDAGEGNGQENFVDESDAEENDYQNGNQGQQSQYAEDGDSNTVNGALDNGTGGNQYANEGGGNQYANNAGGNEYANEGGGNQYANNADGNEYANAGGNQYANLAAEGANAVPEDVPVETAPAADYAVDAGAAPAPAPVVAEGDATPIPGGKVMYVVEGGTDVLDSPGGNPVLRLEQGEHPVTWDENGWYRISTGLYIAPDALSSKGVSRSRGPKVWR